MTLASIGDGVITTDADGRITLLNPVAERLTGWKNEEAAGQPVQYVFHIINEVSREEAENPVTKALQQGRIVGLANHTILIAKDGSERPIGDSAAPIKNDQGETIGVVLVFRDVSEERMAAEAARKNRDIFRLVHQIGRVGHWEWNSSTDENKWSPEIEAALRFEAGHIRGHL